VLADLLLARRLIVRIGDEIDAQFRIAPPEGDWWIGMTLDRDRAERKRQIWCRTAAVCAPNGAYDPINRGVPFARLGRTPTQ